MTRLALLIGLASTLGMVGLIWFVQVVHYPLFARVGASGFALYEAEHSALTTWVVAPLMLAELGSALYLAARPSDGVPAAWPWLGVLLCGVVWARCPHAGRGESGDALKRWSAVHPCRSPHADLHAAVEQRDTHSRGRSRHAASVGAA